MSGPTLTMAPVVKPKLPFHRSHSTPDLVSLSSSSGTSLPSPGLQHASRGQGQKCLPSLPAFDVPSLDDSIFPEFKTPTITVSNLKEHLSSVNGSKSTNETASSDGSGSRTRNGAGSGSGSGSGSGILPTVPEKGWRKRSLASRPHSWIPSSRSLVDVGEIDAADDPPLDRPRPSTGQVAAPESETRPRDRSRAASSGSYVDFARRSWISGSRSPSPARGEETRPKERGSSSVSPARLGGRRSWRLSIPGSSAGSGVDASQPADSPASSPIDPSGSGDSPGSGTSRAINRASVYLTKIKQRPQSVFRRSGSRTSSSSRADRLSVSDAPGHAATVAGAEDSNNSYAPSSGGSTVSATGSMAHAASERDSLASSLEAGTGGLRGSPAGGAPSQDPLLAAFNELEAGYHMFVSKTTTAQRMAVVRTALIPFLRRHAHDPSNRDTSVLTPDDVEHRTLGLGRWWVALLDVLDGEGERVVWDTNTAALLPASPTPQALAGIDRPALLEAASLIMARPEWRLGTPHARPLADRSPAEKVRARAESVGGVGGLSLEEGGSTGAAEHRVHSLFVSCLLAQVALAVEKMSLRHAPLSLVSFAAKSCAYAFFFVPGVADILVRLWGLEKRLGLVARAVDELGLPRRSQGESDDIVALFPPHLGSLGWTSVRAVSEKLRRAARLQAVQTSQAMQATQAIPAAQHIPWQGPWVSRWRGGDTDLFFIFCKHFYLISDEFMPAGLPLVEKARAPAFVLVHSQLLSILDSTVHRQATFEAAAAAAQAAAAAAIIAMEPPLTAMAPLVSSAAGGINTHNNLLRGMDENRLVVLLRDFLLADAALAGVRRTFAEAFMSLVKAAAKQTGRYDHNAQYLLCDFLEVALAAYDGYIGYSCNRSGQPPTDLDQPPPADPIDPIDPIDWSFWLEVCRMMLSNNNTMSEIRVLSFVFSIWDIISADPVRKQALCLDWLLTEDVFAKFFTNWCPMVRAYFMRLLCWRICRDAGSANEVDVKIFLTVSKRLKTVWSHYLWLKQKADQTASAPPSTAPSLPQPGRRFMIVRSEVCVPQRGLYAGLDSISNIFTQPVLGGAEYAGGQAPSTTATAPRVLGKDRNDDDTVGDLKNTDGGGPPANPAAPASAAARRRWSLFGKVLSLTTNSTAMTAGMPGLAGGSSFPSLSASVSTSTSTPTSTSSVAGRRNQDDAFERARKDLAASRSRPRQTDGPPPPPKQTQASTSSATATTASSSSDADSTGSAPVFDAAQFVFRFTLHNIPWQGGMYGGQTPPPRDRILTRPRLPAPAHSRVNARMASSGRRGESPPPPAPGLPPPTRRVSGLMQGGLISAARNAQPLEQESGPVLGSGPTRDGEARSVMGARSEPAPSDACHDLLFDRPHLIGTLPFESAVSSSASSSDGSDPDSAPWVAGCAHEGPHGGAPHRVRQQLVVPAEPVGLFATSSRYAGRALAEWSIVVNECNSFVDRRRDEGVLGLNDVEVPMLGVEGLRRLA